MRDIGQMLDYIMRQNNCSPVRALFLLTEGADENGICKLQPESKTKVSGRLCNQSNIKNHE